MSDVRLDGPSNVFPGPVSRMPIPERSTYIPGWYEPHRDETLAVRSRTGSALGFTVGDVLPERRFALDAAGQCLAERDFADRYRRWIAFTCAPDGRVLAIASVNKYFDVGLEPIPDPEDFVNARVVNDRVIPITLDLDAMEIPRGFEDRRYGADGELASAAATKASQADRAALSKMQTLAELRREGSISEEVFLAKVNEQLGIEATTADEAASEIPIGPPAGFDATLIIAQPAKPPEMRTMPCGKALNPVYAGNHERLCKKPECAALREPKGA